MYANLVQRQQWELDEEKCSKFLGTAKVDLQFLEFPAKQRGGQDFQARTEALKERFKKEGCLHQDSRFRISAVVSQEQLDAALQNSGISATTLMVNGHNSPPDIRFPTGTRIECLYGYFRVQAGLQVLPPEMRWWTVDLFKNGADFSHNLRNRD
jgi:hypothetical protein